MKWDERIIALLTPEGSAWRDCSVPGSVGCRSRLACSTELGKAGDADAGDSDTVAIVVNGTVASVRGEKLRLRLAAISYALAGMRRDPSD